MTKKHYIKIADAIFQKGGASIELIDALCEVFSEDNHLFNREKFLKACEGE